MTVITVVAPSEVCEGASDGASVGMVTAEILSSFGIQASEKGI